MKQQIKKILSFIFPALYPEITIERINERYNTKYIKYQNKYSPFENDIYLNAIIVKKYNYKGVDYIEYELRRKVRYDEKWYVCEKYRITNNGYYVEIYHGFIDNTSGWIMGYRDVMQENTRIHDEDYDNAVVKIKEYIKKYYHKFTDDFGSISDENYRLHALIIKPDLDEFTIKLKEKAI